MFKLIGFYFKSFFKFSKNYIPITVLACAILGYCVIFNVCNASRCNESGDSLIYTYELQDEKGVELLKMQQSVKREFYNKNWTEHYRKIIKYYNWILDEGVDRDNVGIKEEIARYTYLLKENVPYMDSDAENNSLFFLKVLPNEPIVILMLIGILICSAQMFSSEAENKTYKLLYTQSISKNKILFSKLISTVLINFAIIISLILLCFVFQSIVGGIGTPKFLIKAALSSEATLSETKEYITLGKYILIQYGFLAIMIIFTCCVGMVISLLINNSSASICSATVIVALLYVVFKSKPFEVMQKYNPYAYADIDRIVSLDVFSGLDQLVQKDPHQLMLRGEMKPLVNLSIGSGTCILGIGILILIGISLLVINKKTIVK